MTTKKFLLAWLCAAVFANAVLAADKPKLTIDEFFNYVSFDAVKISPDGHSLVIATERADWDQDIFRKDLWLYRDKEGSAGLVQLTQSGHDGDPKWSPDGRWIAFLSERKADTVKGTDDEGQSQLYLISPSGGEAFPITTGDADVHAFEWSPDSRTLYFATTSPRTKDQIEAYKKEWRDVLQYRAAERGDTIFSLELAAALDRHVNEGAKESGESNDPEVTPGAHALASSPWHVYSLEPSPDNRRVLLLSKSVSEREEKVSEFEIYVVELAAASPVISPRRITNNEAVEENVHWANDSRHVYFRVEYGSVEGKYKDTQSRLYWVDVDSRETQRWASEFTGAVLQYAVGSNQGVVSTGRIGTEVQIYAQSAPAAAFSKHAGWEGTYEYLATSKQSSRVAFVHSTLEKPAEVYLAESLDKLSEARPITSFNQWFTERDLPKGKSYRWTADDGTSIEGMLLYPPGKFEAKNLPMFVFIHGGPDDADGNHFEADWYQWDRLAATQGWLVFEPNYRGSTGYGDKFLAQMVPQIVSRPGKDILEGVDALVKDGTANPNRLAVGGYSYGGYMTNWLITQSTRWKAAVTGAGAVENVANWGNDDTTFDDANDLGGLPWEVPQRYQDEAAIFQINKVRTPTHIVAGGSDIRVAVAEAYLLDHALHNLGVPSTLLILPGEGHDPEKPWHGRIKVREELKWLQKYGGVGVNP
jgi:dipeptidyl aminopeptidase/acylaminoacyl peptidase